MKGASLIILLAAISCDASQAGGGENATSGDDTYWSWRNPCDGGRLSVYRSYVHNYQTWQAAQDICQGVFGGALASPSTQCENTFLRTMMMEYYGAEADAWIGLVKGAEGWGWVQGRNGMEEYEYTDWARYEPSGNGDCGVMTSRGFQSGNHMFNSAWRWKDQDCRFEHGFICEEWY